MPTAEHYRQLAVGYRGSVQYAAMQRRYPLLRHSIHPHQL